MVENELIVDKRELEAAIGEAIAVIYRLNGDLTCNPIKCDYHTKLYKLYKYNTYIVLAARNRYKIENAKLELIKCFTW